MDTKYLVKFPDGSMMMFDNIYEYNLFTGNSHMKTTTFLKYLIIGFFALWGILMLLHCMFSMIA